MKKINYKNGNICFEIETSFNFDNMNFEEICIQIKTGKILFKSIKEYYISGQLYKEIDESGFCQFYFLNGNKAGKYLYNFEENNYLKLNE